MKIDWLLTISAATNLVLLILLDVNFRAQRFWRQKFEWAIKIGLESKTGLKPAEKRD